MSGEALLARLSQLSPRSRVVGALVAFVLLVAGVVLLVGFDSSKLSPTSAPLRDPIVTDDAGVGAASMRAVPDDQRSAAEHAIEADVVAAINAERTARDLSPVVLSENLTAAHRRFDRISASDRGADVAAFDWTALIDEEAAAPQRIALRVATSSGPPADITVGEFVNGLMSDPERRAEVLSTQISIASVGVECRPDGTSSYEWAGFDVGDALAAVTPASYDGEDTASVVSEAFGHRCPQPAPVFATAVGGGRITAQLGGVLLFNLRTTCARTPTGDEVTTEGYRLDFAVVDDDGAIVGAKQVAVDDSSVARDPVVFDGLDIGRYRVDFSASSACDTSTLSSQRVTVTSLVGPDVVVQPEPVVVADVPSPGVPSAGGDGGDGQAAGDGGAGQAPGGGGDGGGGGGGGGGQTPAAGTSASGGTSGAGSGGSDAGQGAGQDGGATGGSGDGSPENSGGATASTTANTSTGSTQTPATAPVVPVSPDVQTSIVPVPSTSAPPSASTTTTTTTIPAGPTSTVVTGATVTTPPAATTTTVAATVIVPAGASQFVPVDPARLVDTRQTTGPREYTVVDQCTIRLQVAGRAGVPADATAATLTLTVPGAAKAGWGAMYPSGTTYGGVSNLNYRAREIRANSAIVPLGDDGAIDVKTSVCGTDVVIDVTGGFIPADHAVSSGRFAAIGPSRVFDSGSAGNSPVRAQSTTRLTRDALGVPDSATAAVINITASDSGSAGFVSVFPSGAANPGTSMLNTDGRDQVRAALTIVPLSDAGLDIFTTFAADMTVDVVGYFTGDDDTESVSGLFVGNEPERILDLRRSPLRRNEATVVEGAPGDVTAIVSNVTMVGPDRAGYLIAYSLNGGANGTSTVNAGSPGEIVANLAVTRADGGVVVAAGPVAAAAIMDYIGYFV